MKRLLLLAILLYGPYSYAQDLNKSKLDSLFDILSEKNKAMGSVAILKNGKLVYSNSIGFADITGTEKKPANAETRYRIGSITKMFTAVIIFQLIENKKLNLDDKLEKYFPALPNADKISIENLLNHRSGLHNFTEDSSYLSYYEKPKTQQEMLDIISSSTPDFEPGTKKQYSNTNYVVLGYIAEKISKKTYSQLIKKNITDKLGLTNTYVGGKINTQNNECQSFSFSGDWIKEKETDLSIPAGAGAIVSTAENLVRFIEGLFSGKLVSSASLDAMKQTKDGMGKGMFSIPFYERKALGHNGSIDGFGAILCYFPADSVAFAYCTNGQAYPMNDILIGIMSIYFNRPYAIPSFNSITIDVGDLDKYTGIYSSTQMPLKITVSNEYGVLTAQATGQSSFPLEASGKDVFQFEMAGIIMEFKPDKKEFVLKQGGRSFLFTKEN